MSGLTDAERVAWMTEVGFEFEADGNTPAHLSAGVPDDAVIRGALALVERFGHWGDPTLSPEGSVEAARIVLDAAAAVNVEVEG